MFLVVMKALTSGRSFDSDGGGSCLFLITIDYLSKNGMSSDCEKQIIQRFCLHCKSFSPLHCIVPQ